MTDTTRRVLRRLSGCAVLLAALPTAQRLEAQTNRVYLSIQEPAEWRDNEKLVIPAGRAVVVKGVVSHPSGVLRVEIAGEAALLERVPNDPDLHRFEKTLLASDVPRQITIRVVPRASEDFVRQYAIEPPAAPSPAEREQRAQPVQPVPAGRVPDQPVVTPAAADAMPLPNPWGGFRLRGIGYAGAAVGGAVLMTLRKSESAKVCGSSASGYDCVIRTEESPSYFPLGAALVGGAIVAGTVDALMTSRRARGVSSRRSDARDGSASVGGPELAVSPGNVGVQWLTVRF